MQDIIHLLSCCFVSLVGFRCVAQRANIKLRRDGVCRSVSMAVTSRIRLLAQYQHSRERVDLALQSQELTHSHKRTLPSISPNLIFNLACSFFSPVLTLSYTALRLLILWRQEQNGEGELRHFILSIRHCVNNSCST